MDQRQVIARVDDWESRLDALCRRIDEWYAALPPDPGRQLLREPAPQRSEPLLREFDVPPRMLPARAILTGKDRVSFVPSSLWVVGANGRVNATTGERRYVLVDLGGANGGPSDWQVVTSQLRHVHRPFDQAAFNELVLRHAIEAA